MGSRDQTAFGHIHPRSDQSQSRPKPPRQPPVKTPQTRVRVRVHTLAPVRAQVGTDRSQSNPKPTRTPPVKAKERSVAPVRVHTLAPVRVHTLAPVRARVCTVASQTD